MDAKKWVCMVCGYIYIGVELPDECPLCGINKMAFEFIEDIKE